MSPVSASCPTCGAPVIFRLDSSLVTICESCSSVVARADRDLESIGRVVDLVQTASPLVLWLEGRYEGVGFQLTGRAQMRHGAGGIWDEWYLAFDDDRWGWLAEAQGRYFLTFRVEDAGAVPGYEELEPGSTTSAGGGSVTLTVMERAEAEMLGASGEIPYRLEPGRRYRYADLSGSGGEFATLDYGDTPPSLYLGREVTLAEMGLDKAELREVAATNVGGVAVACPNCGGSLDLKAPDETLRVICPYCDAVLDANKGVLTKLKSLNVPKVVPALPLGSEGKVAGRQYTVIGFMQRSVTDWGVRYYWDEYLLHEPHTGFRWLTVTNGHWSFVEPIEVGKVEADAPTDRSARAHYDGTTYKVFSHAVATVEYVSGEFYWKVEPGDQAELADYIAPPYVLSMERTDTELAWSRGVYLPRAELEQAFEVSFPETVGSAVGLNQPYAHQSFSRLWKYVMLAAIAVILIVRFTRIDRVAHEQTLEFAATDPVRRKARVQFSDPFGLRSGQNIMLRAAAPVDNSWVFLSVDIVNAETGLVHEVSMPIEYYHGVSGGESWSEGGRYATRWISALPTGTYMLRVAAEWKNYRRPMSVNVVVRQGTLRARHWLKLIFGLLVIPFVMWLRKRSFETRRWADSTFSESSDEE